MIDLNNLTATVSYKIKKLDAAGNEISNEVETINVTGKEATDLWHLHQQLSTSSQVQ